MNFLKFYLHSLFYKGIKVNSIGTGNMKGLFVLLFGMVISYAGLSNNHRGMMMVKTDSLEKSLKHKIKVLNFATFHMGETSDANSTEFDENNKKNQREVHEIAQLLAKFKPTVILVENTPNYNQKLKKEYLTYITDSTIKFKNPSEVELLAFELGRLSGVKKIYGIDHKLEYNYRIGTQIENKIDATWYNEYYRNPYQFYPDLENMDDNNLSLLDKLKLLNDDEFLDFVLAVNADMLTHAGSEEAFEGADEAAKCYQRNLRMYSNLNRIELDKDDRVFILMGASHTAFFRDFISRSPKYEMVNTFDYLK